MTSRVYGYARVSSDSQDLSLQVETLRSAGAVSIFSEKVTGVSVKDRHQLTSALAVLHKGDTLLATRVDRIARSILDLQNIVQEVCARGAFLRCTEQPVDTSTAAGKCFLDMLGVFSEFETNLRRERQLEGIAKAKQENRYKGRVPTARRQAERIIAMKKRGYKVSEIVTETGVSRASIYRILKD